MAFEKSFVVVHELDQPSSLLGKEQIDEDVASICNVGIAGFSPRHPWHQTTPEPPHHLRPDQPPQPQPDRSRLAERTGRTRCCCSPYQKNSIPMMVRGLLDPGLEQSEEEREQGWVIRHHERKARTQTQPEARRKTSPKDVHCPRHIDRPALQSWSFGGQDRSDLRTIGRRPDWFLKMPSLVR